MENGTMGKCPSAMKTYSVAFATWAWALFPKSCGEWTSIFELIGSMLAVALVAWRLQREIRHKHKENN